MAMVVKNNLSAVRTLNVLNSNSAALQKGMARVSSGMKITGAQDDAAGFAISERMRVRIRALDQANQNTQNDSALMKTAEGAVGNTIDILKALKEKCINAANDSNTDEDRLTIQKEIDQYIDQIDDNALVTFNGKYLIDGSKNNAAIETKTVLLNQSLATDTKASDALTSLKSRTDESLNIQSDDYYQLSWVQNGDIHTTSGKVGDMSLKDILSDAKVPGKILETGTDENGVKGLIMAEEDAAVNPTYHFKEVSSNASALIKSGEDAVTGTSASDAVLKLQTMFNGVNGFSNSSPAASSGVDKVKDAMGNRYWMQVEDGGELQEVDISIEYHEDNTDAATNTNTKTYSYTITVKDADGNDLTVTDGKKLYTADHKYTTNDLKVDSVNDGNGGPITFANGALNQTSAADLEKINSFLTAIGKSDIADLPTTATKLSEYGIYEKNGGTYQLSNATVTLGGSSGTYTVTFAGLGTDGVLYKVDKSDPDTAQALEDGSGTANANPKEISIEEPVENNQAVQNKFERALYTPDKTEGLAFVADDAGVDGQVGGLTISILDQDLNVKKAVNAALDQFKQYQRAENKTGDRALNFHIGSEANQAIKVGLTDMRAQALGLKGDNGTRINVNTKENANASINVIENALTKALDQQTTIGAVESRLEYTSTNLTTASENVQASESTIRDADMAKEMTNYTKANVLLQAAQAMLAQANQSSSSVLSLLQ